MSYPYYFILIILTVAALLELFQDIKQNILDKKLIKISNKLGFEKYGDSITITMISGEKGYHIYLVQDSKKDIYLSNGKRIYKLRQKSEVHEFIYTIIDSIN